MGDHVAIVKHEAHHSAMTFDDYQKRSRKTVRYPNPGSNITYPALGLAGEAGEVANKIKKIFRDDDGHITSQKREEVHKELGDVLWYLAQLATEFDLSFNEIAQSNAEKLESRMERGTIQGSGDTR